MPLSLRTVCLRLVKRCFLQRPAPDPEFLRLCQRYVWRCRAENNGDMRTNGELQLLRRWLPACRVVFDVGANVGDWTAAALEVNPNLAVHAFEPSVATCRRLRARGLPPNVVINERGLSSAPGTRTLFTFADGSGGNSLYRREGLARKPGMEQQAGSETVTLDTLDRYLQAHAIPRVDFLKVDVEGHELDVFRGGAEAFARGAIRRVQFEYGGCNIDSRVLLLDLFHFFAELPYVFCKLHPDGPRPVPAYTQDLESFQYQNWVLYHRDEAP